MVVPVLMPDLIEILIFAQNHLEFLRKVFALHQRHHKNFTYAKLAEEAGYASRNYARDVIMGDRRLTPGSLPKFAKAFRLNSEMEKCFTLLASLQFPDLYSAEPDKDKRAFKLERSRQRLKQQLQRKNTRELKSSLYRAADWPFVFASLGTLDRGSNLNEIAVRSCMDGKVCKKILHEMIGLGMVSLNPENGIYRAISYHLISDNQTRGSAYQSFFIQRLRESIQYAEEDFESPDHAYLNSVLSIQKSDLPRFKKKLQAWLRDYAEEIEAPEGDGTVSLSLALIPRR